ncbi:MAG: protein of unknown function [Nitrospira sp.]
MLFTRLSFAVRSLLESEPRLAVPAPVSCRRTGRRLARIRDAGSTTLVALSLLLPLFLVGLPFQAEGADRSEPNSSKLRKTVAAGFGVQTAESSMITVKTYDAESGEILSDESYELDIKEDRPTTSPQSQERIVAGGVGIGADGLSEFMLRVYDAADGKFLWEGRLNLNVSGTAGEAVPVAVAVRPHATVTQVAQKSDPAGQPFFLLRVLDRDTGQLMWFDQFSTEGARVRAERVNRAASSLRQIDSHDVDFRIRMFDGAGRRLLWEDRVAEASEGSPSSELMEDGAGVIPQWFVGPTDSGSREEM